MILIICVDDENGLMFNGRRQSQDRILRADILRIAGAGRLWMNAYSAGQFKERGEGELLIDEDFLERAGDGEFCFLEDADPLPYAPNIEGVILYRWNRRYPADRYLTLPLSGFTLEKTEEFAGSSHEKITREIYRR